MNYLGILNICILSKRYINIQNIINFLTYIFLYNIKQLLSELILRIKTKKNGITR